MKDECNFRRGPAEGPHPSAPAWCRRYSFSSKRPAMRRMMASIAWPSSEPSVSTMRVEPWAAASIITPMMLLALTRRPLRVTQTLALNWPATCVSLADARACSPSLLMISTSRCSIVNDECRGGDAHDPVATAAHGLGDDNLQRLVAVGEDADQHGEVHARDAFDLAGDEQLGGDVGGRAAVHVGEDQHAIAFVELLHELPRLRQQAVRVVLRRDADLPQA